MRSGITTGTCAAAAAKAAMLAWLGQSSGSVTVASPQGREIQVAIHSAEKIEGGGRAVVIKDAGDDPDITNGSKIVVEVLLQAEPEIVIRAGEGVGTVTKPGLSVAVGEPAVNPGPRRMICLALTEILPEGQGAVVTISVPGGTELAQKTLNPALGICGGISIIGTTGIVEPMSEEAFKKSLSPQISVVKAQGYADIVFVPGKIGENIALRSGLPPEAVVQTSNFIGYMLEQAVEFGIKRVLLFGHPGKIAKVAAGNFHTHNRVSDARLETMAAHMALAGAPQEAVSRVMASTTTEAAAEIVREYHCESIYLTIAGRASQRAERYVFGELAVGTVIVTLQGEILGMDSKAREIGESMGWTIRLS